MQLQLGGRGPREQSWTDFSRSYLRHAVAGPQLAGALQLHQLPNSLLTMIQSFCVDRAAAVDS